MQVPAASQDEKRKKLQIFAERLKSRRLRLGMTQEDVAERAKVSPRSVVAWESGQDNIPQGINLSKLTGALDVPVQWLLGESSEDALHELPVRKPMESGGARFGWMSVNTLEKSLADLAHQLQRCSPSERKHLLGNIAEVLGELENRELKAPAPEVRQQPQVNSPSSRLLKKSASAIINSSKIEKAGQDFSDHLNRPGEKPQ
jgi:transcriptional regulator with XRE-family HTH domain